MAFCRNCGTDIANARFCPQCGTGADESAQLPPAAPSPAAPQPPPAPPKRRSSCSTIGCLSIIAILFVLWLIGKNASDTSQHGASNVFSSTQHHVAVSKPRQVLDVEGSGTNTTQRFTTGDDWDLVWTYDCSNFDNSGNFIVSISGDSNYLTGVNQLGASGHGIEHYHQGGNFYLEINSECDWHVRAVSL